MDSPAAEIMHQRLTPFKCKKRIEITNPGSKETMELLFKNPTLRDGVNITIRDGLKCFKPGDLVELVETDGKRIDKGIVLAAIPIHIKDIPERLLDFNHDPSCRTMVGLLKGMDNFYGRHNYGPQVTLIVFWVFDRNPLIVLKLIGALESYGKGKGEEEYDKIIQALDKSGCCQI